jgi:hypothetical protein
MDPQETTSPSHPGTHSASSRATPAQQAQVQVAQYPSTTKSLAIFPLFPLLPLELRLLIWTYALPAPRNRIRCFFPHAFSTIPSTPASPYSISVRANHYLLDSLLLTCYESRQLAISTHFKIELTVSPQSLGWVMRASTEELEYLDRKLSIVRSTGTQFVSLGLALGFGYPLPMGLEDGPHNAKEDA